MPAPQTPPLISPGDILQEKFMVPLQVSSTRLARDFDVSERTVAQILAGQRRISKAMAHKLHMRFKTSTQYWLSLQSRYDQQKLERWETLGRV